MKCPWKQQHKIFEQATRAAVSLSVPPKFRSTLQNFGELNGVGVRHRIGRHADEIF
jgi:hypothetical protein